MLPIKIANSYWLPSQIAYIELSANAIVVGQVGVDTEWQSEDLDNVEAEYVEACKKWAESLAYIERGRLQ
jgi:hypothetical protein